GNVVNNGGLVFNRGNGYAFGGVISGTGSVTQQGAGTTVLSGNNSYTGATTVSAGGLYVNGDQTAATGVTTVNNATLGGKGVIGGDVTLTGNSTLSPGDNGPAPGTLTIKGNLALGSGTALNYSFGQANVAGGPLNDLTNVGGNVALGGKLNVALSPGGRFDVGIYRIINYGGTLSNPAGLTLGTLPAGANAADYFIQTSVDKQVNLAYTNGLTLNYWDGDAGPKNNNQVNGGAGTWVAPGGVNDNWTDAAGSVNAPWSQGAFAVFTGQSGTVLVDSTSNGPINVQGMQFATDGYVLQGNAAGDKLTLTGTPTGGGGPNEAVIRVGAGSADGAGYTATIAATLAGAAKLVKTDLGTLVLSGVNTYTGGTAVNGGTLQVSQNSNMGDLAG
ncbi:autotransporter-associated beta strand repeat-containing protein, partial [Achromobacter sp. Marseille-Q0513]|uniref:autotransporter-associated beta strand repeat-containing protein n=1 Tax=Achromobacter sp. Marseille-Q0513 TaxID=2829161 RepID=UPI001B8F99E9